MVLQTDATFQQFIHSKFRENIIRVLYLGNTDSSIGGSKQESAVFLVVNKYGGVGLYDAEQFSILHTYMLDLSVPMKPDMSHRVEQITKQACSRKSTDPPPPTPLQLPSLLAAAKCQRTHVVVDAVHAPDVNAVFFATSKNIVQVYDLGDIESLSFGLEIFPRQRLLKLRVRQSPVLSRNRGHVETHRIFPLPDAAPFYCMEYVPLTSASSSSSSSGQEEEAFGAKLIIGDKAGIITIINIPNPKKPFGKSKGRGVLHKILCSQLERDGLLQKYRAHQETIREISWVPSRRLIVSCSRDEKFSLFIKDYTETVEPYIISLQKGVNTFAHNDSLKIIATGSDDCIVRLFNQYVMKMPQMELVAHKSPIIGLEFLQLPFSDKPLLISYATDAELRVWDPVDFVSLQSVHVSFPIHSEITASKTPEFGKKPLIIHQPHYNNNAQKPTGTTSQTQGQQQQQQQPHRQQPSQTTSDKYQESSRWTATTQVPQPQSSSLTHSSSRTDEDGYIMLLYCNAYAQLTIERDKTYWPFDFDDFVTEFQERTTQYERKMQERQAAYAQSRYSSKDPNVLKLTPEEIAGIEAKLDNYVREIIKIKRHADKQLRSAIYDPHKESLAGQTTRKFLELQTRSQTSELLRKEGIRNVFKYAPLYELEPVEFSTSIRDRNKTALKSIPSAHVGDNNRNNTKEQQERKKKAPSGELPTTNIMREDGIGPISSTSQLLTPKAKKFFTGARFRSAQFEAAITARTARERFEHWNNSDNDDEDDNDNGAEQLSETHPHLDHHHQFLQQVSTTLSSSSNRNSFLAEGDVYKDGNNWENGGGKWTGTEEGEEAEDTEEDEDQVEIK